LPRCDAPPRHATIANIASSRAAVEAAVRCRDASEIEPIEIEIASMQTHIGLLVGLQGGNLKLITAALRKADERISEFELRKAELQAQARVDEGLRA
jgi:hypothetical protein